MKLRNYQIILLFIGLSLNTGCTLERSSRDLFANIEGMPYFAKALQKQSLSDIFNSPEKGWREYELGRRLENGIGIEKDNKCAAYWYYNSSISEYDEIDTIHPGYDANKRAYTNKYYGVPHARNALKRMKAKGTVTDADIDNIITSMVSRSDQCYNNIKLIADIKSNKP